MCLFAPLKSSTVPDMKWVLLKCLLIELDTNEVMVPFKAQSGGRRLAVVGGGGVPSAWVPHPAPTGQLPHGRPSPSPAATAGRASNPTPGPLPRPSRLPVANGCGQSLRGEPRGPGGAVRARLELGHREAKGYPPAPGAARLTPRAGLPNLQTLGASLPGPSSDWSCSAPQARSPKGPGSQGRLWHPEGQVAPLPLAPRPRSQDT